MKRGNSEADFYGTDGSNNLILGPRKKKKTDLSRSATASGKVLDLKKAQKIKALKRKKEEKVTKSKKKELKRLAERQIEKKTRSELIASLQEVQLANSSLSQITPTVERSLKKKKDRIAQFPSKLRAVQQADEPHSHARAEVHYDTGSSEEDCDDELKESGLVLAETREPQEVVAEKKVVVDEKKPAVPVLRTERERLEALEDRKKRIEAQKTLSNLLASIKGARMVVQRTAEIEEKRAQLPIYSEEQMLVEEINDNAVTIISGETGSGKTTQVPQFLYEAGYTSCGHLIGVTEPRRVAAMSMSERVGVELNDSQLSSFQIRFESNRTDDTKILFMTDGVLLKELQADVQLKKFSVIIIDEAHERSMYSDVLIGLLARIALQRAKTGVPLKLIIMSATLRMSDFMQSRLFPVELPKLISVESRQFPVTTHFEKRTPDDYMEAAFRKVCKIHERLPDGGILVFVSGQKEVHRLITRLNKKYSPVKGGLKSEEPDDFFDPKHDNAWDCDDLGAGDCDDDFEDSDEEEPQELAMAGPPSTSKSLHCLPLYSMMPSSAQQRVFKPPPANCRVCVVATNVAETSLTIPGIRFVVDTGKEKRRDFDPVTGVSHFRVCWASQASAAQRSGRAGRVSAGHAYRLYSSAVFEDMPSFPPPEILHKPVDQVVLHLKAMNIRKIGNFPFPTPPAHDQVEAAEQRLRKLGALALKENEESSSITALGKTILNFPLAPHFGKMLVVSNQHGVMPFMVSLISALSVREPMINVASLEGSDNSETQELMVMLLKQRRNWGKNGQAKRFGDLNVLLRSVAAADADRLDRGSCVRVGLRYDALKEIRKMRRQLTQLANSFLKLNQPLALDPRLGIPTETQIKVIRQIFVACQPDQIAKRVVGKDVPRGAYRTQHIEDLVFIDATSALFKTDPEYVLYQEIVQLDGQKKLQMVSEVEPEWLTTLAGGISFPAC